MLNIESTINLNSNHKMPLLGLGVWQIPNGRKTEQAVEWALQAGYKHFDTAKFYKNESSVGRVINQSNIPRDNIWVTTKIWPTDLYNTQKAFEDSLKRLELDYIDLYLVHWPIPGFEKRSWKSMEKIYESGRVKSIGVSNYSVAQLKKILSIASVPPAVNQIKCSPFNYKPKMYEFCIKNNIALEAYSPLTRGSRLADEKLSNIAKKYKKSTAQILIRWALQKNIIVIPKSDNKVHIDENANVYNFELNAKDMHKLDKFTENKPDSFLGF